MQKKTTNKQKTKQKKNKQTKQNKKHAYIAPVEVRTK